MMTLLLDSALKATPILAVAWMAAAVLCRASADLRHRIWLAAILGTALLPAALWIAPEALPASVRILVSSKPAAAAPAIHFPWVYAVMFAVWLAGMIAVLARLVIGHLAVARLTPFSDRIESPMTWGMLKPVILLPSYMRDWGEDRLEMAIRHEQAHIARHDWLWQTLGRIVTAVFWFHPLIWVADAALRREAERAADDCVLSEGAPATDYAAQLLDVARSVSGARPMPAVAMARTAKLEGRVKEILDGTRNRSRAGIPARIGIVLIAIALLAPLAAIGQNETVHKIGEPGLSVPFVISKTEPEYTPEARGEKIQGTVVLHMVIDPDGMAREIQVTRSVDAGLDQKALEAVSHWKFEPAKKNGNAVRCAATIEVNFRLI